MNKWNFDENTVILPNGLKVITIKKDTQLSSIDIGVNIGALYENEEEKGLSHFIEHMLFKGTKTRDNETLNLELEALGGEYNAYTDYSATVYSITCLEEEIINAVELLSDMIISPSFNKHELEREIGVVLAEIRTSKDDIEDLSFKKTSEVAFTKSPLKNEIIGTEENIQSLKRKDLIKFYNKYYKPDNIVVSLLTSMEHSVALDIIKKYFGDFKGKAEMKPLALKEKNNKVVAQSFKRDMEQSTITYLFSLCDLERDDELPLKILNHKLGESANSILFRELREKRGLAYDVYTHLDLTKNIDTLNIFTAVSEESIDETIKVINKCIEDIKNEKIVFDESTLSLMKKVHKTAVVSTLEDGSDLCNYVMHQALAGEEVYEFIDDMKKLDNLNSKDIYAVARKLLNNPTIHILRPSKEEEFDEEDN
ncbi:Predicted Zn-dependent peptidase [Clostridium cavendishii DSM 21758]|uniref:Predicted Zn-dependent peptidase n=1 Tax=Clostridium cavendishii DSM 21758 TaxID=1121302 RepID=A0A1M6A9C5_9CLOT|nr:pitrilysin family protein [Clostridium cavendishii]SHI32753.1 Predicted Zn-dependent peptidase [Clostridium cavendishii DSM 21758]